MDGMTGLAPWTEVGRLDDIPRWGARVVATAGGDVAMFRTADDAVFAVAAAVHTGAGRSRWASCMPTP